MSSVIVEVSEGKLEGKVSKTDTEKQYYAFKGIPYATPPIGELRFAAPLPPKPWEGVRDATKDCNICAQFSAENNSVIGDEDCLYLNVYTPKLPSDKPALLPVIFFIHGGAYLFGNGTNDYDHGPDFLIEKDVVVVGFNYRLGILGFLSLDIKEAPGNMGLRDQVLALKWVQQNIAKFNGDPNNVSLFGFSAGGASVEYLLMSPLAKGLFQKAIIHSGSSLLHWAQNKQTKDFALDIPVVNAAADDRILLNYLKDLPTDELIKLSMSLFAKDNNVGRLKFRYVPTIEKSGDWEPFLNKCPYEILKQGNFTEVPLLTGFCNREGLLMYASKSATVEATVKEKNLIDYLPFKLDVTEKEDLKNELQDIYNNENSKFNEPDAFVLDFFGDIDFLGGIHSSTKLLAKNNSSVYLFEFAYEGNLNYIKNKLNVTDRTGSCHGDDTGYLLKCGKSSKTSSDTDKLVIQRMVEMWTNFAKYGDPTPKTDKLIPTKWEPVRDSNLSCMVIGENLTMNHNVYTKRSKLFEKLYEKYQVTI